MGTHKTGSTSIQNFIYTHRKALAHKGVLYPSSGLEGIAHHRLAWATGTGSHKADEALLRDTFASIAREANSSKYNRIFISSEEFESTHEPHLLAPLLDQFEVKVVIYLRKQDHLLESTYNQHVRQYDKRFDGSIYQLALKYNFHNHFNYRRLTERWESVFGRDNLLIRIYGTAHVQRDVREDLLSLIGVDSVGFVTETRKTHRDNISLATTAVPYMARINQLDLNYNQHQKALSVLAKLIPEVDGARLLSNWESTEFYKKFEMGNRYIAERYLGLNDDPFAELKREPPEETHIRPGMVEDAKFQRVLDAVGIQSRSVEHRTSSGFLKRRFKQFMRTR